MEATYSATVGKGVVKDISKLSLAFICDSETEKSHSDNKKLIGK